MRLNAKWTAAGVRDYAAQHGFTHTLDVSQPCGENSGEQDFAGRRQFQTYCAEQGIREGRDVIYKSYRLGDERRLFIACKDAKKYIAIKLRFC